MWGGVCVCRDPALCLDFLILLCLGHFWASTFGQWPETNCQILSTWNHQKCVRFEPGRRGQLWMLRLQTETEKSCAWQTKSYKHKAGFRPTLALYEKMPPSHSFERCHGGANAGVPAKNTPGCPAKKLNVTQLLLQCNYTSSSEALCWSIPYMQAFLVASFVDWTVYFTIVLKKDKMFAAVITFQSCKMLSLGITNCCAVFWCLISL